ncbi:MAG: 30S ribosomal protein S12 methylthiotransferase RimO [Candidatus Omnitrophica bacterium]|nr:30S ribosomal protein S12 methylthiotransferase RimO [Candidatus Omnitrophota bacterium]
MKKVYILSLGCPRNLVDSEIISGRLKAKDYTIVDTAEADVAIVNTCAFIKEAKEESIEAILDLIELKEKGILKKVIVAGCLAQRYGKTLTQHLKEVDGLVGRISLNHTKERFRLTPPHYAYVKISEGCINNCSYCVIPKIKGRYTSRPLESILTEVRSLDRTKTKEINIIGQDITLYGTDLNQGKGLELLLREILKCIKHIRWIRLLYLHPAHLEDGLLDLLAKEERLCRYIDLPLQHINNRLLKLMQRKTSKEEILRLIEKIRKKIPQVAIRTSLLVGFPSETDDEFEELIDFVRQTKFERLGAFIYSREEGTLAYNLKPQIPLKIKQARFNRLMSLQQEISQSVNQKYLGTVQEVLIDERQKDNIYLGRTQMDAPEVDGLVYIKSDKNLKSGDFVKVKITDTLEYDLVGELA